MLPPPPRLTRTDTLFPSTTLFRSHRPAYNVLLRDDKSFPFILLRADHAYPRIQKHRGARRAKGNYYGPFASAGSVNQTLNALEKLFLLRSYTDGRSEEHTSELQSLMRISYAVFFWKNKNKNT